MTNKSQPLRVFMDGVKVGSTPLTALTAGLNYNINRWYFSLNLNYYDRVYIGAATYCRLGKVMDNKEQSDGGNGYYISDVSEINVNTGEVTNAFAQAKENGGIVYDANNGNILAAYTQNQEKFKGGFMLDASVGKGFNLRGGKYLSVNLSLQNITNNTKLKTGGYEQNRADRSTYIFSKNSYYYYANAFNAYLNINLRF